MVKMVESEYTESPSTWGDVRVIVAGDSLVGSLTFKDIPGDERPKLRAKSYKNISLSKLLPIAEEEIKSYKPHLIVICVGRSDMVYNTCQHFKEPDHQHRVFGIQYEFNVKLAAEEMFRIWHEWLAKYNCKVLFAVTYPMDFEKFNKKRLNHCQECQESYDENGQREIMAKRIKEWIDLMNEKDLPFINLSDVINRMRPDEKDFAEHPPETAALVDGWKVSDSFAKHLYWVVREQATKLWPFFVGGKTIKEEVKDDTPPNSPPQPPSPKRENNDDAGGQNDDAALPKKKSKHAFRF